MENTIIKLAEKLDNQHNELDSRLDNIEKVMIAQEINLKEHMRRSDYLEQMITSIQDKELKPLHKHVAQVEGVFKFLGLIALILTIASGIGALFGLI
jgi:dynactin complex subunit